MQNIKREFQTVISKAWEDDNFRKSLVESPKESIKNLTGLDIPQAYNLVVNDQTDVNKIFINIPPKPNYDDMDLTDEQLEQVAGGEVIVMGIAQAVILGGIIGTGIGLNEGW